MVNRMSSLLFSLTKAITFFSILLHLGCASSVQQTNYTPSGDTKLTAGLVQKEIRKGMDQSEVVLALGSPNIVTRDKTGRETWVYDKISSEVSYKKSEGYGTLLLIGGSRSSGGVSSSKKTLTVVIKFSEDQMVDEFSYNTTSF